MALNANNLDVGNNVDKVENAGNVENLSVEYRTEDLADTESIVKDGPVKWFDAVKGYGFFVPGDNSGDILIHKSVLRDAGIEIISEGTIVVCEVVQRERGQQATRVISMDDSSAIAPMPKPIWPVG